MQEWSVLVETWAKGPIDGGEEAIEEGIGRLVDFLGPYGGAVSGDGRGSSARIAVYGADASEAVVHARATVQGAAVRSGLPRWSVDATEWERFSRQLGPE